MSTLKCRACLRENIKMYTISLFVENTNIMKNNAELLMACSSIHISRDDGYPQQMCIECLEKLTNAYSFKRTCEESDRILRNVKTEIEIDIKPYSVENSKEEEIQDYIKEVDIKAEQFEESTIFESGDESDNDKSSKSIKNDSIKIEIEDKYESKLKEKSIKNKNPNQVKRTYIKRKCMRIQTNKNLEKNDVKVENSKIIKLNNENEQKIDNKSNPFERRSSTCVICEEKFKYPSTLNWHVQNIHKTISCKICNREFTSHRNLKIHINIMHGQIRSDKPKNRICVICDESFSTAVELQAHVRASHKSFACKECGKLFNEYRYVTRHMILHRPDSNRRHLCSHCGKGFTDIGNLNVHIRIHTGVKPYECKDCGKSFAQWSSLRSHIITHTGEKKFSCEICGKPFARARALNGHLLTHSDERNFPCALCEKRFKDAYKLKEHMVVHSGVKKFKCEICGKAFGFKKNLTVHQRVHTGDKPHVCHICGHAFTQGHCLRSHLNTHHKTVA